MNTSTHTKTRPARRLTRRLGLFAALAALAALMVAPASSLAAVRFGSLLNPTVQPSNSLPGLGCEANQEVPSSTCTMVQEEAYGRPDGGELAPKTGTIKRIRLIAGGPGSFQLQIAKVKRSTLFGTNEAKVVRNGPRISYTGQTEANEEEGRYNVESFPVSVPVKKGQQLALQGNITSMIRCSSGGDNTLIYTPPLSAGSSFRPATNTDGCWILMEAVIK
ncbi:MAG TPA: hypothetical protein VF731_13015 [Solirubrobacterales bacterium]